MSASRADEFDVVIIGGGPAGATTGYYLARSGLRVAIVEQTSFPRYCVGESLLPHNLEIFREMGFDTVLEREGFLRKYGAVFGEAVGDSVARIDFSRGLRPDLDYAYQVPRDRFDELLLEHARAAGVHVVDGTVKDVIQDGPRVTGVELAENHGGAGRRLCARLVVDASGRRFFLARRFGLLEADRKLDTAACYGLFHDVGTVPEAQRGDITILAFEHGWFWFIPFADGRTSVGVVVDRAIYDDHPEPGADAFFAGMTRIAGGRVSELMARAKSLNGMHVLRRFSRRARRFAGPGWVLVGDAAMFIDPVFSAGVMVATTEGRQVARTVAPILLAGREVQPRDLEPYARLVHSGYEVFERYIYGWKDPAFRHFFLHPPPYGRAVATVTTILAGGAFDRALIGRGDLVLFVAAECFRWWQRATGPLRRLWRVAAAGRRTVATRADP